MRLKPIDLTWALHAELPALDFVLPGLLPGSLGLMVGPGGTGKSFLAMDIAVSMAVGRTVAGGVFPSAPPRKVVYLAGEEGDRLLAERLREMLDLAERSRLEPSKLVLIPMSGKNCLLISKGYTTDLLDELEGLAKGAALVIIDPIRRLHDGDENDSTAMTQVVVAMEGLAKKTGAAILGLHHTNRAAAGDSSSQHASRGSTALVDGARWQINLSKMDERAATVYGIGEAERLQYVALDYAKGNYLPPNPRCWLKRKAGGSLTLVNLGKPLPKGTALAGARLLP